MLVRERVRGGRGTECPACQSPLHTEGKKALQGRDLPEGRAEFGTGVAGSVKGSCSRR